MLPTFIHSTSEFQAAVQLGSTPESLVLEFKETINDWNPPAADPKRQERRKEAQKEMCRDIAQFANTLGGCLLVGVSEQLDATRGIKVSGSIAPIQEVEQLR
jgi:predicted HTH transcriptional regulator